MHGVDFAAARSCFGFELPVLPLEIVDVPVRT
jgi:hypothetical protein